MSETAGEKTFAPTAKRKLDAARKGDVLRSKEGASAAAILFGAAWLMFAGPWLFEEMSQIAREGLIFDRGEVDDFQPGRMMKAGLMAAMPVIFTIAVPMALLAFATQLGFGGEGRWVNENLAWKGSRINPLSGLKRMFGLTGLIEMGKGMLKVGLLGAIAFAWGRSWLATIMGLGGGALSQQLSLAWSALISLVFALAGGLVVIALIDVPIQWMRRNKRLMMSHQEMRDEHKESEGSPEAKAHRRQRQRDIAMGGVAGAMREAQFMLTNPTHFAVAMVYDPSKAGAPIVLAKGRGDKAQAMKELAREYGVPLLEFPQLTRAVYYTTRENQTIREELYAAVASVLTFVFSLKRGESRPMPTIDVPVELRFEVDGRLAP